jgi:carboxymethylenebutenolidase
MLEVDFYPGQDGRVAVTIAAIVLGHELFGMTDFMLDSARLLARQGYLVAIPDQYTNDTARDEVTLNEIERAVSIVFAKDQAVALAQTPERDRANVERAANWLRAAMARQTRFNDFVAGVGYVRGRADVDADRIALIGWCGGGAMVAKALSAGAPVKAGIVFYGRLQGGEQAQAIQAPFLGHFAENDKDLNAAVPAFADALQSAGKDAEIFTYAGTAHGFCNFSRAAYDEQAAALAWERTYAFLKRTMR